MQGMLAIASAYRGLRNWALMSVSASAICSLRRTTSSVSV